jgi:Uma2 family endonuclease
MTVHEISLPALDLPTEDGEPLESNWHRAEINLLIESIRTYWSDRTDYYMGGNMFVYYSDEQARTRDYRGPDFFVVLNVDGAPMRGAWVVWLEDGRYPNVIVELLSPSTAEGDRTVKKALYEQTFCTSDYFIYDPDSRGFQGWHLVDGRYVELQFNEENRLWCEQLGLWVGPWDGKYLGEQARWLRFFDPEGNLVLIGAELAAQAIAQVDTLAQELRQVRAELERLRTQLGETGIDPDPSDKDA